MSIGKGFSQPLVSTTNFPLGWDRGTFASGFGPRHTPVRTSREAAMGLFAQGHALPPTTLLNLWLFGGGAYSITVACGMFSETGKASTLIAARNISASYGPFVLTGISIILGRGYVLSATSGSFSETGKAATLVAARTITTSYGPFSETGKDAILALGRNIITSYGSFVLDGKNATLARGYAVVASVGSFSETGIAVTLISDYKIPVSPGSFSETGIDATLATTRNVTAAHGSFSETGEAAILTSSRSVTASYGSFALIGEPATFNYDYNLMVVIGSFSETGVPATLISDYLIHTSCGLFTLVGEDAILSKEGGGYPGGYLIVAASGVFSETGISSTLTSTRNIYTLYGSFSESGISIGFSLAISSHAAPPSSQTILNAATAAIVSKRERKILLTSGQIQGIINQAKLDIDYRHQNLFERVKRLSGEGIDIIYGKFRK